MNKLVKKAKNKAARLLAVPLLIVLAGSAIAQQAPPRTSPPPAAQAAPAPQAEVPQRTTASYGDWTVQCDIKAGPPPQKLCDMSQVAQTQVQGRSAPFSRVAVAHPVKGEPVKLSILVPVNVSFSTYVRI